MILEVTQFNIVMSLHSYQKPHPTFPTINSNFLMHFFFIKRKIWCIHSNITNFVTVLFMKICTLSPIRTFARNLLFWYSQINQCAKSNSLWNSFLLTSALRKFDQVLFSSNVHALSTFSSVAADLLFPQFPLSLFRLYLNYDV